MLRRLSLMSIGVAILSCLFAACGVRPQVNFYVRPVAVGEEQRVNEETVSVDMEDGAVSITISAVDAVDLLEVTSDPYLNPYLYIDDWGVARPRYTIFDVIVKYNGEDEFTMNLSNAVLMDDEGEQYEAIPYEEFKERYGAYPRLEREIIYHPSPRAYYRPPYYSRRWRERPWYYHYDRYRGHGSYRVRRIYNVSYLKGAVLKGTMYRPVMLYPGGKRQGLLVFPRMSPDTSTLKIIVPNVVTDEGKKLEFRFERIPVEEIE